jgi:hypothetical protein
MRELIRPSRGVSGGGAGGDLLAAVLDQLVRLELGASISSIATRTASAVSSWTTTPAPRAS